MTLQLKIDLSSHKKDEDFVTGNAYLYDITGSLSKAVALSVAVLNICSRSLHTVNTPLQKENISFFSELCLIGNRLLPHNVQ